MIQIINKRINGKKIMNSLKNKKIITFLLLSLFVLSSATTLPLSKAQVVGSGSIDSGLVGYWRFDEGSGVSVLDSSGCGNVGVVTGATFLGGKYGTGLSFNGGSNFVRVSNSLSLNFTSALTFSVWVYPVNVTSAAALRILTTGTGTGMDPLGLTIKADGKVYLYVNGVEEAGSISVVSLNSWSLVTASYNGSYTNMYINGVWEKAIAYSTAINLAMNPLYIGNNDLGTRGFNGTLDNVRIYNRALSNSEVALLYSGYYVSVSHDLGSTITPNGTVNVGVDQTQSFTVGSLSGYFSWTSYIDGVAFAPSPVINITCQSNRTLYVTSQFIGDTTDSTTVNDLLLANISFILLFILTMIFSVLAMFSKSGFWRVALEFASALLWLVMALAWFFFIGAEGFLMILSLLFVIFGFLFIFAILRDFLNEKKRKIWEFDD